MQSFYRVVGIVIVIGVFPRERAAIVFLPLRLLLIPMFFFLFGNESSIYRHRPCLLPVHCQIFHTCTSISFFLVYPPHVLLFTTTLLMCHKHTCRSRLVGSIGSVCGAGSRSRRAWCPPSTSKLRRTLTYKASTPPLSPCSRCSMDTAGRRVQR